MVWVFTMTIYYQQSLHIHINSRNILQSTLSYDETTSKYLMDKVSVQIQPTAREGIIASSCIYFFCPANCNFVFLFFTRNDWHHEFHIWHELDGVWGAIDTLPTILSTCCHSNCQNRYDSHPFSLIWERRNGKLLSSCWTDLSVDALK